MPVDPTYAIMDGADFAPEPQALRQRCVRRFRELAEAFAAAPPFGRFVQLVNEAGELLIEAHRGGLRLPAEAVKDLARWYDSDAPGPNTKARISANLFFDVADCVLPKVYQGLRAMAKHECHAEACRILADTIGADAGTPPDLSEQTVNVDCIDADNHQRCLVVCCAPGYEYCTIDGRRYDVTPDRAAVLYELAEARGKRLTFDGLRCAADSSGEPRKLFKALPGDVRALFETRKGRAGGVWLRTEKTGT